MSGEPDPKPRSRKRRERRGRDAAATRAERLSTDECAACGRSAATLCVHHILYGGEARYRVDDPRNLLVLCHEYLDRGRPRDGCHVAFHGGDREARARIARAIAARPEKIAFVTETLGEGQGRDYLRRRYGAEAA